MLNTSPYASTLTWSWDAVRRNLRRGWQHQMCFVFLKHLSFGNLQPRILMVSNIFLWVTDGFHAGCLCGLGPRYLHQRSRYSLLQGNEACSANPNDIVGYLPWEIVSVGAVSIGCCGSTRVLLSAVLLSSVVVRALSSIRSTVALKVPSTIGCHVISPTWL